MQTRWRWISLTQSGTGGHFLAEPHTVEHFRQEFWLPELIDRESFPGWEQKGKSTPARSRESEGKEGFGDSSARTFGAKGVRAPRGPREQSGVAQRGGAATQHVS